MSQRDEGVCPCGTRDCDYNALHSQEAAGAAETNAGPYRTPGVPTPEREPAGQCPRCGEDVWDLAKWAADGHKHDGCLGSHSARMKRAVDAAIDELESLRLERDSLRDALQDLVAVCEVDPSFNDPTNEPDSYAVLWAAKGALGA